MRALKLAGLVCLLFARLAAGEWRIVSETNESSGVGNVARRHIIAENSADAQRVTMEAACFANRSATLRVIDSPEASESLAEVMQRENCVAGVNGGYFDPEFKPVGLMISDGRVVAPFQKARLLSGVLSAVNGRVQILRSGEFSTKSKPAAARQCGPFLIERGMAIAGLNNTRAARRTFVATMANGDVAIGYCSYTTLAQLAALLAVPELKIQRALNMDGGSSSGFWFKGANGVTSIHEQKTVRDYLAVVPK